MIFSKKSTPRFWICFIIITTLLFVMLYLTQNNTMVSQSRQLEELEQLRVARLEENERLKSRIEFAKTDQYIERYARSELGFLKEGEIRFVTGSATE